MCEEVWTVKSGAVVGSDLVWPPAEGRPHTPSGRQAAGVSRPQELFPSECLFHTVSSDDPLTNEKSGPSGPVQVDPQLSWRDDPTPCPKCMSTLIRHIPIPPSVQNAAPDAQPQHHTPHYMCPHLPDTSRPRSRMSRWMRLASRTSSSVSTYTFMCSKLLRKG